MDEGKKKKAEKKPKKVVTKKKEKNTERGRTFLSVSQHLYHYLLD